MPKVIDHEAYRCELLQASFDVVAKTGYGSLSMKQLARSLNISAGLIYHYFENKEDWFVSLVTHFSKEVLETMTREIPAEAPLDTKCQLLVEHVDRHKELYANMISVASDFVRMPRSDEQHVDAELAVAVDQVYEIVAQLFDTDEATARALVSQTVGMVMSHRLDPRGIDAREHLPYILRLVEDKGTQT